MAIQRDLHICKIEVFLDKLDNNKITTTRRVDCGWVQTHRDHEPQSQFDSPFYPFIYAVHCTYRILENWSFLSTLITSQFFKLRIISSKRTEEAFLICRICSFHFKGAQAWDIFGSGVFIHSMPVWYLGTGAYFFKFTILLLLSEQSMLTIFFRISRVRLHFVTPRAEYAYILLHHEPSTLVFCYTMSRVCLQFVTAGASVRLSFLMHEPSMLKICFRRIECPLIQFVTACAEYAYILLHEPSMLTVCYRMR